jgi:hypothetical protein
MPRCVCVCLWLRTCRLVLYLFAPALCVGALASAAWQWWRTQVSRDVRACEFVEEEGGSEHR